MTRDPDANIANEWERAERLKAKVAKLEAALDALRRRDKVLVSGLRAVVKLGARRESPAATAMVATANHTLYLADEKAEVAP